jgi:hypothetical protein
LLCCAASSIYILSKKESEIANAHIAAMQSLGLTYAPHHNFKKHPKNRRTGQEYVLPSSKCGWNHPFIDWYDKSAFASGRHRLNEIPSVMKELLAHQIRKIRFLNEGSAREETNLT